MAYAFNGTDQYLSLTSIPVSAYGATFFARGKTSSTGSFKTLASFGNSSNNDYFINILKTDTNFASISQRNSNPAVTTVSTGTAAIDDDLWHEITGKASASNSVTAYTDGVAATTGTTNISAFPSSLNTFSIGAIARTTTTNYWSGNLAEAAIWNVALTDDEIGSLAKGFKPTRVRPQSLVFYAPLIRDLQDLRGALAITNNNTATAAEHPRVY